MAKKRKRKPKWTSRHPDVRELPFSYGEADRKQARLYLILIHLKDNCLTRRMFDELRHVIFGMVEFGLRKADREDIFQAFLTNVIQPWMINRFVRQRFLNAIRDCGKHRVLLKDDFSRFEK